MPYRRLPNTDLSRLHALQKASDMEGYRENGELVLPYQTTQAARLFLNRFRRAQNNYDQCHQLHTKASKEYRMQLNMARMYVSHFLQVLSMTIQRGELRKEIRTEYGLDPESNSTPDLSSEQAVQDWGDRVIKAEELRIQRGGVPIYNPTIAKVKVYWQTFSDRYYHQVKLRKSASTALEEVTQMRPEADDIILDIWNQVEGFYADLPLEQKIEKCKRFGLIYYYRKGEKERSKTATLFSI